MNKESNITICRITYVGADYLFLSINKDNMYFDNQPFPSLSNSDPSNPSGDKKALMFASDPNTISTPTNTTINDINLEGIFIIISSLSSSLIDDIDIKFPQCIMVAYWGCYAMVST